MFFIQLFDFNRRSFDLLYGEQCVAAVFDFSGSLKPYYYKTFEINLLSKDAKHENFVIGRTGCR